MEDMIIVGSGPAGYTAAIYASRAGLKPLVITGNLPGGLLTQIATIENYPGFVEPKNGFDLIDSMREQAERLGATVHYGCVTKLDLKQGGPHIVTLDDGSQRTCRTLIIAVGSRHVELGLKSESALKNKGVSYCAVCDGAFYKGKDIVVAGGSGDTALIEALYLTRFATTVHLVHKHESLQGNPTLCQKVRDNEKIQVHLNASIAEIHDIKADKVTSVTVKDKATNERYDLPCSAVFIAVGQAPNTDMFTGQIELVDGGYIKLVDPSRTLTSVEGVFAAGDCADSHYKQVVTAAATGCKAALDALQWLQDNPA